MHSVLLAERQAILNSNFDQLDGLTMEKTNLLAQLSDQAQTEQALQGLAVEIARNQRMLEAARRGVEQVADRLLQIAKARDGFDAYGPSGGLTHVGPPRGQHERKA